MLQGDRAFDGAEIYNYYAGTFNYPSLQGDRAFDGAEIKPKGMSFATKDGLQGDRAFDGAEMRQSRIHRTADQDPLQGDRAFDGAEISTPGASPIRHSLASMRPRLGWRGNPAISNSAPRTSARLQGDRAFDGAEIFLSKS